MGHKMSNTMFDALMLFGGGIVGAGLAFFLAPQSGRKSRKDVARFGRSMSKKSNRVFRGIADDVKDLTDTMTAVSERVLRRVH